MRILGSLDGGETAGFGTRPWERESVTRMSMGKERGVLRAFLSHSMGGEFETRGPKGEDSRLFLAAIRRFFPGS
jgi:hypothetical protein